jgi:hypothetical protein
MNLDLGVIDRVIFSGRQASLAAPSPPREKASLVWPGRLTKRQRLGFNANYVQFREAGWSKSGPRPVRASG